MKGWEQNRQEVWRNGNRRDRESGGMKTEEKGSLEGLQQKRQEAWRNGNRRDPPGGMETE